MRKIKPLLLCLSLIIVLTSCVSNNSRASKADNVSNKKAGKVCFETDKVIETPTSLPTENPGKMQIKETVLKEPSKENQSEDNKYEISKSADVNGDGKNETVILTRGMKPGENSNITLVIKDIEDTILHM